MYGEEIVDLEALDRLLHTLALQEFLGLDPFLGEVDIDRIAHRHPEPSRRGEALDQLLGGGLDQALSHPAEQGQQDQIDLARRDPEAIAGLDLARLDHRGERERLLDVGDPAPPE